MVEGMPFSYFFHPVRQNVGVMPGPGQPSWATNWKPQMKGGHITWWKEPGSLMLTVILPTLNSQLLCKREKETSNLLKPFVLSLAGKPITGMSGVPPHFLRICCSCLQVSLLFPLAIVPTPFYPCSLLLCLSLHLQSTHCQGPPPVSSLWNLS